MNIETQLHLQPAPVSPAPVARHRAPPRNLAMMAILIACGTGGGAWWWTHREAPLPAGIVASNGRLEMDEIDIQTKFAARVKDILVDEGDAVQQGQVLARMDVADLRASLAHAQAMILQADEVITQSMADLDQARPSVTLWQHEVARTASLLPKGFATQQTLDQQHQQLDTAMAAVRSATARIAAAQALREAARQDAALISVNIADDTLMAPRIGLIQYRLANVGEVLPAGGKLYTLLDTHYAYMDVFLPTAEAGQAVPGRQARIVLDAWPNVKLPAHVVFLASENQFTPKMVETRTERDKLMFRVRVRIDDVALTQGPPPQAGMPGIAYIRGDPAAPWPPAAADPPRSVAPAGVAIARP